MQLTVKSAFSTLGKLEANVTRVNGAVPRLYVEGPLSRNQFVNSILQLTGRAEFAECSNVKGAAIVAQWTQVAGTSLIIRT
jgi:hypothetical protein